MPHRQASQWRLASKVLGQNRIARRFGKARHWMHNGRTDVVQLSKHSDIAKPDDHKSSGTRPPVPHELYQKRINSPARTIAGELIFAEILHKIRLKYLCVPRIEMSSRLL